MRSSNAMISGMSEKPKILMCRPEYFDVVYEINAWMHKDQVTDVELAKKQWQGLYEKYVSAGYEVSLVEPAEDQPDMVFTANGALSRDNKVVLPKFKFPERQGETKYFRGWFEEKGDWEVLLPENNFEGEGDALFVNNILYGGYGFRSDPAVYDEISKFFEVEVKKLHLVNENFYHLDTCFSVLDNHTVAFFPGAFDEESCEVIRSSFERVLEAGQIDADGFGLNLFCDNKNAFVSAQAPNLQTKITELGFDVIPTDVSEFKKAGGGIKCMTLLLNQIH